MKILWMLHNDIMQRLLKVNTLSYKNKYKKIINSKSDTAISGKVKITLYYTEIQKKKHS